MKYAAQIIFCISLIKEVSLDADKDGPKFQSVDEVTTSITVTEPALQLAINVSEIPLPLCNDDELVFFNGANLSCGTIPERMCRCPVRPPIFPRPPPGCTIFSPPDRGALVCLLLGNGNRIYCSVVCDNQSEFSDFPLNPYTCGDHTQFRWVNFFDITQDTLPQCSGFRHSERPLLQPEYYFLSACRNLSSEAAERVKVDFCHQVEYSSFNLMDCSSGDITIQCGEN